MINLGKINNFGPYLTGFDKDDGILRGWKTLEVNIKIKILVRNQIEACIFDSLFSVIAYHPQSYIFLAS